MTLQMGDSITATNIPKAVPIKAGYVDGQWKSYYTLVRLYPDEENLGITTGGFNKATAADIEKYDYTITDAPRLLQLGVWCLYISVSNVSDLLNIITRPQAKIWTAHYSKGKHICSFELCNDPLHGINLPPGFVADGTQWTDHTTVWDESLLQDDFFSMQPMEVTPMSMQTATLQIAPDGSVVVAARVTVQGKKSLRVYKTVPNQNPGTKAGWNIWTMESLYPEYTLS